MAGIEGFKELQIKLDSLYNPEAIQRALLKSCLIVENSAKIECPVDDGQLRNSITHRIEGDQGIVYTNVEYAPYVEYGTGLFAVAGNGRKTPWVYCDDEGNFHTTAGQRPQPYLLPALNNNRDKIIEVFRNEGSKK